MSTTEIAILALVVGIVWFGIIFLWTMSARASEGREAIEPQ